jgi:hypothetical protein
LARVQGIQRTVTASIIRIVKRETAHPVAEAGLRRRARRGPLRRTKPRASLGKTAKTAGQQSEAGQLGKCRSTKLAKLASRLTDT